MKSQIISQCYEFNQSQSEIINILLSTIAPFLCCYLHVIETITEEVNNLFLLFNKRTLFLNIENLNQFKDTEFTEKELLVNVQQRVENGLNSRENHMHPYCLSLDSISIALTSFQINKILTKTKR